MTTLNENQKNLNSFVQQHGISQHNYETMILVLVCVMLAAVGDPAWIPADTGTSMACCCG